MKPKKLYGSKDQEILIHDNPMDYVDSIADGKTKWPVSVHVYNRVEIPKSRIEQIAYRVLNDTLESLDEDFCHESFHPSEPTRAMEVAAQTFAKIVVHRYEPSNYEPTGEVIEVTEDMYKTWFETARTKPAN